MRPRLSVMILPQVPRLRRPLLAGVGHIRTTEAWPQAFDL